MALSRYSGRIKRFNSDKLYKDNFEARGIKFVRHFTTPVLRYPTDKEKESLSVIGQIWKVGDRYYKLADDHYGDPAYWWVIAWYNKKPTEAHLNLGDYVYIPTPLHKILEFFGL
tara:strand:- start:1383 stop:1724 length:342 start_codon:yes stop_codon:yes gene_type:complete